MTNLVDDITLPIGKPTQSYAGSSLMHGECMKGQYQLESWDLKKQSALFCLVVTQRASG